MADDRMKNDDLQRNMGKSGEGQDYGQQTPGRNPQGEQQTGQQGGQGAGQYGTGQQQGGSRGMDDDEDEFGSSSGRAGQTGSQNRGGQNR
jgi:hypothetical protein